MKIFYIAETSLTNKSAYSHHVIKMCDAFVKLGHKTSLITSKKNLNLNLNKMKRDFALRGKNPFKVFLYPSEFQFFKNGGCSLHVRF